MKYTIMSIFFLIGSHLNAQSDPYLLKKIHAFKTILTKAAMLDPMNNTVEGHTDTIANANEDIYNKLSEILLDSTIRLYNLDSVLKHPYLRITHSLDNKLWNFSWPEKTGGSNKTDDVLFAYQTSYHNFKISGSINVPEWASTFGMDTFYKLTPTSKKLYLGMVSGLSCNTCTDNIAGVIELRSDSIYFDGLFFNNMDEEVQNKSLPYFRISGRLDNIKQFDFDSTTQTLNCNYVTDDMNATNGRVGIQILRRFKFNGEKFTLLK